MLDKDKLLAFNRQGLIPGPDETYEAFLARASYCRNLKSLISNKLKEFIPFQETPSFDQSYLEQPGHHTQKLYDLKPDWIPLFFSNDHLSPWHGGCALIFQIDETQPTSALLQLKKRFQSSNRYLGIYDRDEIIAHELCHVGRMLYEEPKFEEMLSYQTSPSKWRRFFGPLVQSSLESLIFFLSLLMTIVFDAMLIFFQPGEALMWSLWAKTIPLAMIAAALIRLLIRHRQLKGCVKALSAICSKEHIYPILYRLTDEEIIAFQGKPKEALIDYFRERSHTSLRLKTISLAYLPEYLRRC